MPSWPFKLEGQVFNGMDIVSTRHMNMEDEVLYPDSRVCGSVVRLYVYWFESFWEFVIQNLIGEA